MTVPSNTFKTYEAKGNREDLADVIWNIDPTETPFLSGVEHPSADAVLHEWQTDSLAAASGTNAQLEGDDANSNAATPSVRLSNTCQISTKSPVVSKTQEAVKKAGRKSEMGYQVAKMGQELKRDMETILLQNQAEVAGDASTARKLGSVLSWIDTNTSAGSGGSDGSLGNTARTDASTGNRRAFTEDLLTPVLESIWTAGGNPGTLMLGAFNKRKLSTFTGNATRQIDAVGKKLVTSIDVYESDWGVLQVVPNRFMRTRDALALEMRMWGVAYLREFELDDLAKTGDNIKKLMACEYTLESRNEKASGGVFDLTDA
jgi:hypothetical protein